MDVVFIGLAVYFGIGFIALGLLDTFTKRIRNRLFPASRETQSKMTASGNYMGDKSSILLTLIALWLFWPIAIYGAVIQAKGDSKGG